MKHSLCYILLLSLCNYASFAQWSTTGNSGTTPETNFLGTTDNQHLILKTNNVERLRLLSNGNFLLGSAADYGVKLQVEGEIRMPYVSGYGIRSGGEYLVSRWGLNNASILGFGPSAATGDDNFGALSGSLSSLTSGTSNIGIGRSALSALTTGSYNVSIGSLTGYSLTSGYRNTMVGTFAGLNITTGAKNIFIGMNAGRGITTGSDVIHLCTGNDESNTPSNLNRSMLFTFATPLNDATVYYNNLIFFGGAYNGGIASEMDFVVSPLGPSHNSAAAANTRAFYTASNGLGTNSAGSDLQLSGGRSTGSANPGNIIFWASQAGASGTSLQNRSEKARIAGATGNLLIGTATDDATNKLQVNGSIKATGLVMPTGASAGKVLTSDAGGNATWQTPAAGSGSGGWALNGSSVGMLRTIGTIDNYALPIITNNVERMRIGTDGNVGIGTVSINDPGYKLFVETGIRTRKVRVDQAVWADYVFQPGYLLRSLKDVEQYIQKYSRLPEILSAAEVKKEGIDLGANQALLLKKIEELTLYAIEQNKKLEEQQVKIEKLERMISTIKK